MYIKLTLKENKMNLEGDVSGFIVKNIVSINPFRYPNSGVIDGSAIFLINGTMIGVQESVDKVLEIIDKSFNVDKSIKSKLKKSSKNKKI